VEKQEGRVVVGITVLREMHVDSQRVGIWVSAVDSGTGSMLDEAWDLDGMCALLTGGARMIRKAGVARVDMRLMCGMPS
jgi:hypothetical protein